MIARLISGEMATLHELQTVYSLSDAMYLDEVLNLKQEAQFFARESD